MDAQAARDLFAQYQKVLEDIWIEKQCCRNFILSKGLISEAVLEDMLEMAKLDSDNRTVAAENFAGTHKALMEIVLSDSLRQHLSSPPSAKDKQN